MQAGCEAARTGARNCCHFIIPDTRTQRKGEHFIHSQVACLKILEWGAECEARERGKRCVATSESRTFNRQTGFSGSVLQEVDLFQQFD